jgi:hypothetical protein
MAKYVLEWSSIYQVVEYSVELDSWQLVATCRDHVVGFGRCEQVRTGVDPAFEYAFVVYKFV